MKIPLSPQIRVRVTEEIIGAAMARDSRHCMIAEAVKAAYPAAKSIAVDLATIRLTNPKKGLRYVYLTPRIAQRPLVQFDQGVRPEPFDFLLRRAHVTYSGSSQERKAKKRQALGNTQSPARRSALTKARAVAGNTKLVDRDNGTVPDRVGGQAPPLQPTADGVPFSRRRAFGLRALQL
jgi:hypothetical protein